MKRSKSNRPKDCPYVGKGGLKLQFALEHFALDVADLLIADLGCHIGGFTDCLLQHGARKVYAVDTAYGLLEWKLRTDERVVVHERTNALHWDAPELVDFIVSDLGWTKQQKALPIIANILKPGGKALSLLKPQYESEQARLTRGVVEEENLQGILERIRAECPPELNLLGDVRSPYIGNGGNVEYWLLLEKRPV